MKLSAQARSALMARLARGDPTLVSPANPIQALQNQEDGSSNKPPAVDNSSQGVLGPSSPIPTPCLLLKNMFDPESEESVEWDKEIEDDVREECSKFGVLEHIHVDKDSKGFVYLKFSEEDAASRAQAVLHGRWFAGRQISAEYQVREHLDAFCFYCCEVGCPFTNKRMSD